MKKFLKKAFSIGLLVFTVLLLVVIFGYHLFFADRVDNYLSTTIQSVLTEQLQREVSVESIHLSFPNPKVVLSNLTIAREQALSDGTLLAVKRAEIQVSLRSLLSQNIVISDIILDSPAIWVEFDEQGNSNLPVFAPKKEEKPKEPSGFDVQKLLERLYFPRVQLIDANIHFVHRQQQLRVDLGRLNTLASFRMKGFHTIAQLSLEESDVEFQDRGSLPISFDGNVTYLDRDLSLSSFQLKAGNSSLEVDGTIRKLPQAEFELSLVAQLALDEINRLGQIGQNLSGIAGFEGSVSGTVPDIRVSGHLSCQKGTAWKLAFEQVGLDVDYQALALGISNLSAELWDGKASGDAQLSFAGTPNFSAKLTLDRVELSHVNSIVDVDPPLDIHGVLSGDVAVGGDSFDFNDLLLEASLTLENDYIYGVDIEHGQGQIRIAERTLFIDQLFVNAFQGDLQAKGRLALYDDFPYQVELDTKDVALGSIMALIPQPPDVAGNVNGTIGAEGSHFDLTHLLLDAELDINSLNAYGVNSEHIQATVRIENEVLSLPQLLVEIFDGSIQGKGRLGLSDLAFDSQLKLDDIVLETLMRQFAPQSAEQGFNAAGKLNGEVQCRGDSFALEDIVAKIALKGEGRIDIALTDPENLQQRIEQAPFDLTLNSNFQDGSISIKDLRIDSAALQVDSSGSIDLRGPSFDLSYDVAAQDLQTLMKQVLNFVPGIENDSFLYRFAGNIKELNGSVQGPLAQLEIAAKAHLSQADLAWVLADDLRAEISFKENTLHITQAKLRYQGAEIETGGSLKLDGEAGPELHLPLTLKAAPLTDYLALAKQDLPLEGHLKKIDAVIQGPASNLVLDLALDVRDIDAWGQSFDSLRGDLNMADNQIRTEALTLKKNGGSITAKGGFGFDLSFQAEVESVNLDFHDIDALAALALQYEGKIDLNLKAEGSIDHPQATAEINLKDLSYAGAPIEEIRCNISLAGQKLQALLATFREKIRLSLELGLTPDLPYSAELNMSEAAIEQMLSIFVELEGITGLISGKILSKGKLTELQDISADVKLGQLDLDIFGQKMRNAKEIDIVVTPDALHVNSLEMGGEKLGLFAQGLLDFRGSFDLDIDGILDLRSLKSFLPKNAGLTSLAGHVQLICSIDGNLQEPRLEGLVEINRGNVKLAAYPDPITGIDGKLAFAPGRIEIIGIQGQVSKGTFEVEGHMAYSGLRPKDFSIDVEGKRLVIEKLVDSLAVTVSPRIRLSGDLQQQKLTGEIQIHDALYNKEIDFTNFIGNKSRDISLTPIDMPSTNPIMLELFIKAPQNVRVKNKLAEIDLKANLRVLGTALKPQIEGRIEIPKGKVVFGNIRYDILSGVFDFIDPVRLNPEMNVQVETMVQEYDIKLGIDGNLDQFSLSMSSDPPLSDSEIAQLLAGGSQTDAYSFVTRPLQTLVEGKLEEAFKLDRISVDVDPLLSKSKDSEATPTVTVAKRFFDTMLLTYTTSVGGTDKTELFEVEYELSDKMSISAQRDQDGEMDTSVTFKFKFK